MVASILNGYLQDYDGVLLIVGPRFSRGSRSESRIGFRSTDCGRSVKVPSFSGAKDWRAGMDNNKYKKPAERCLGGQAI